VRLGEQEEESRARAESQSLRTSTMSDEVAALASEKESLRGHLEQARERFEQLRSECDHLRSENVALSSKDLQNKDEKTYFQKAVSSLKWQRSSVERERLQLQEDKAMALSELASEKSSLQQLRAETATLRESLQSAEESARQREDEKRKLQADHASASADLTSERRAIGKMRSENQRLETSLQQCQSDLQSATARASEADNQHEVLMRQVREFKARALELRRNLDEKGLSEKSLRDRVAQLELSIKQTPRTPQISDQAAVKRVAELLVGELPSGADAKERHKAQRQLLSCLHPDKCPSKKTATELMQEVQTLRAWLPLKGAESGGA